MCFFVETIMDDFMEHLRQYKRARQLCEDECEDGSWAEMSESAKAKQTERTFFEKEPPDNPWKAVVWSQPARLGKRWTISLYLPYILYIVFLMHTYMCTNIPRYQNMSQYQ